MCINCGNSDCDSCSLGVAKGDAGEKGNPAFMIIPVSLVSTNSVTYVECGRIIAGTDVSTAPFTAAKIGIYTTSPSTGQVRIRSLDTAGNYVTLYENTAITSNVITNIEAALQYNSAPLDIVSTPVAFIVVEILNQTGTAKNTYVTSISLFYQ